MNPRAMNMTRTDTSRIRRSLLTLALATSVCGVSAFGSPRSQEEQSREQAALAEEQQHLSRQLNRLIESMETLARRFESEGRKHAADLLRKGLEHLTARDEEASARTITELMEHSREDIETGLSHTALERQEIILNGLDRLLVILMDRDTEDLDKALAELKDVKQALEDLADDEQELRKQTAKLREDSADEQQKALEAGIAEAIERQRELLAQNEREARESGLFDLEALRAELDALTEKQSRDSQVLEDFEPGSTAPLEALREPLEETPPSPPSAALCHFSPGLQSFCFVLHCTCPF